MVIFALKLTIYPAVYNNEYQRCIRLHPHTMAVAEEGRSPWNNRRQTRAAVGRRRDGVMYGNKEKLERHPLARGIAYGLEL